LPAVMEGSADISEPQITHLGQKDPSIQFIGKYTLVSSGKYFNIHSSPNLLLLKNILFRY